MRVLVEGFDTDELFALPAADLDQLLFPGHPIVFQIGSAQVLAEFSRREKTLSLDLAHIDGGGEGVLLRLGVIARRYARLRGLQQLEWLVRATCCADPNPKLRPLLERRGFLIRDIPARGECYYGLEAL